MSSRRARIKTKVAKRPARAGSVRELLDEVLASLKQSSVSVLFPDGVRIMDVSVSIGANRIDIKLAGNASTVARMGASTAPESCREAFRVASLLPVPTIDDLTLDQKVPNKSEAAASGGIAKKIKRTDPEFADLVENTNPLIVFKDEEGTGADRMMCPRLKGKLDALAELVIAEWSGVKLRVTEAWDEDNEHAGASLHYEGRAADLTTEPNDPRKLGRLGRLAVNSGFDWVWYENSAHIHVSVKA
jgi:hypothetical protein